MPKVQDVHLRKLGAAGIITDTPPHELPAQVFNSGVNARFRDDYIQRIGGYLEIMEGMPEEPLGMVYFKRQWVWAGQSTLYVYEPGVGHTAIYSESSQVLAESVWNFTEFSGVLVASHTGSQPVYWNGVTIEAQSFNLLPDWGTSVAWTCTRLRGFKNQLFALNMWEDGVHYPQRVRFSDIAQPNVPPDEWVTSTTNSAGFIDLSNATGPIVDGYTLGNGFMVYTKNEVYQFTYIGGNEVYSVRQIFNDGGALMTNSIASFNNSHLVITSNDVYIHDGSSKKSVIDGKIKDEFFKSVQAREFEGGGAFAPRVEAFTYKAVNEIWLYFTAPPETGGVRTYYQRVAIWNYNSGAWSFATVPDLSCVAYGGTPTANELRWDNANEWDPQKPDMTWDGSSPYTWGVGGKDFEEKSMMGGGKQGFFALDQGATSETITIPFILERSQIDLDESMPGSSFRTLKTVMSIYPQFEGTGSVEIRLGHALLPTDSPIWGTPVVFNMKDNVKADFRETGRYFSIRITSLDAEEWKLSGLIWQVGIFGQER